MSVNLSLNASAGADRDRLEDSNKTHALPWESPSFLLTPFCGLFIGLVFL